MGSQGQCSTLRALGRCRLAVSVSSSRWEMKGPYSVLVNRRGPSCPPWAFSSGGLWMSRLPQTGAGQFESTLPSCLPSLLQFSPGLLGRCHCHIAPVRARFCLAHVVSLRTWVHEANAMHEEPGKNVPFRTHPTSHPTAPAPAGCSCSSTSSNSSTDQWAPAMPAMPRQIPSIPCAPTPPSHSRTVLCSPATP